MVATRLKNPVGQDIYNSWIQLQDLILDSIVISTKIINISFNESVMCSS